jgi:hypothetical protein
MAYCRAEFKRLEPRVAEGLHARFSAVEDEVEAATAAAAENNDEVDAVDDHVLVERRRAAVVTSLDQHLSLRLVAPVAEACCFFGLSADTATAAVLRDAVEVYAGCADILLVTRQDASGDHAAHQPLSTRAAWAFRHLAVLLYATVRCRGFASTVDHQHALAQALERAFTVAMRRPEGRDIVFGRAHVVGKALVVAHTLGIHRTPFFRRLASDFCDVSGTNRRLKDRGFDAALAADTVSALAAVDDFRRGRSPADAARWLADAAASGGASRKQLLQLQSAAGLLGLQFPGVAAALELRMQRGDGGGLISFTEADTAPRQVFVTDTTADYTALEGTDAVYAPELESQRSDWAAS